MLVQLIHVQSTVLHEGPFTTDMIFYSIGPCSEIFNEVKFCFGILDGVTAIDNSKSEFITSQNQVTKAFKSKYAI